MILLGNSVRRGAAIVLFCDTSTTDCNSGVFSQSKQQVAVRRWSRLHNCDEGHQHQRAKGAFELPPCKVSGIGAIVKIDHIHPKVLFHDTWGPASPLSQKINKWAKLWSLWTTVANQKFHQQKQQKLTGPTEGHRSGPSWKASHGAAWDQGGDLVFFCWDRGWRWIKNQGTPRFVNDCTFHINFIWLLLHVSYIYSIGSLSRLLFCLYHSLPYRYWATHSADEVGTQTISPFYWALESGSFHSAKVGCGKELKLGFTRNVGIPQIHPNPTCGRCWYCDTSFTAKQKASNVVCVSVIFRNCIP